MLINPINEAEAIIEPFWDPLLSELGQWTIDPGTPHGLVVRQNWCHVAFAWTRRPADGPALRMRRVCGLDCGDYDGLVLSVMAPPNAVVRMIAETDAGVRQLDAPPAGILKKELVLDLAGATRLEVLTLEVVAGSEGIARGWFNWVGLQHHDRLARRLRTQTVRDERWVRHLKNEAVVPQFRPSYGLVLSAAELDGLRRRHATLTAAGQPSPFVAAAEAAQQVTPEALVHDYVNFWNDSRYNRERDHGKFILNHGLNAALAGHLLQDARLLRLAARFALSIAWCDNWDDGFICRFPGSTFEHRCFVQSLCAYEVAAILDLAGECFTDLGRDFLLRRLAEEALGSIQYNTWRHDYIFGCNQLAWFTPGRMLALGVLNRHWPRVRPYLDIAYHELCDSLDATILADGGYVEGPTYFRCVGRDAGLGIYYYGRAIDRPLAELVPASIQRCGQFAAGLISTDDAQDMVPICDARSLHDLVSQAFMATRLPGSAWGRMLHKALARNEGWPVSRGHIGQGHPSSMMDAALAWQWAESVAPATESLPPVVALPDMGPLVSHRRWGGHWVKLLIQGNRAGAGHTHEDKGSFVLEFAGDTFALDPGSCDYSHPLAGVLQQCERHNMLVPFGFAERPAPCCPLPQDVKPRGTGDATAFHAEINVTPGWERYYRHWHRTWDSPAAHVLTITDDYEIAAGDGVEFYWQTRLPVRTDGGSAVITGRNGRVILDALPDSNWRVDQLPLLDGVQYRLVLRRPGRAGRLTVKVRLDAGRAK